MNPLQVRAPRGADTLEIDWSDGHTGIYPHTLLRGYCPCAGCQGHSTTIRFQPGGNTVIDDITEVGNYALAFRWGDGHDTGIYDYRYLRRLCACPQCAPGAPHTRGEPLPRT